MIDSRLKIRKDNGTYRIVDYEGDDIVLSKTILHPHQSTTGHKHSHTEIYYFIGSGIMQIGDDIETMNGGEFKFVSSSIFHRVSNNGNEDLEFLCTWRKV